MTDKPSEKKSESWRPRWLRTDTDRLREALAQLSAELTEVRVELERTLLEADTATVALQQQKARATQLESELVATREDHGSLTTALEQEQKALGAANGLLATCATEIATLRAADEREQRKRKQVELQRDTAMRERETERLARAKQQETLARAQARCGELEAGKRALDDDKSAAARAYEAQLEIMTRSLEDKDRSLAQAEARCRALETANTSLTRLQQAELEKKRVELENKQKELLAVETQRTELAGTIRRFQDERNEWSKERAALEAAMRRLLDEQDSLSTQHDNLQRELMHKEQERTAEREQWSLLSQRFWKALERVLGNRAAMALSRTPDADAPSVIKFSDLEFSKVSNSFAMLGLYIDMTVTELSPGSIELRLSGPSVATTHGAEPSWFSAIALAYLESACECSLYVHQLERSGDDLLLRFADRNTLPPTVLAARHAVQ